MKSLAEGDAQQQVAQAISALGETYDQAQRDISTMPPRTAFAEAGRLHDALDVLRLRCARLRAESVQRLYTEEGLSMSAVARRFGLSKGRIDQLVRKAKGQR